MMKFLGADTTHVEPLRRDSAVHHRVTDDLSAPAGPTTRKSSIRSSSPSRCRWSPVRRRLRSCCCSRRRTRSGSGSGVSRWCSRGPRPRDPARVRRGLMKALGDRGVRALERLMGMLLVLLAVQMLLTASRRFLATLQTVRPADRDVGAAAMHNVVDIYAPGRVTWSEARFVTRCCRIDTRELLQRESITLKHAARRIDHCRETRTACLPRSTNRAVAVLDDATTRGWPSRSYGRCGNRSIRFFQLPPSSSSGLYSDIARAQLRRPPAIRCAEIDARLRNRAHFLTIPRDQAPPRIEIVPVRRNFDLVPPHESSAR